MTNPNRQPAGVPTGGQFTASQHGESDLNLDTPNPSVDDLDVYLMTDQPTDCPRCQHRTVPDDLGGGREHHTCGACGYEFVMHSPEVDGEEQCEVCREFASLSDLDDHQVCSSCRAKGGGWCEACDDFHESPDDCESEDHFEEDAHDDAVDQAWTPTFTTGRCATCGDAVLHDPETAGTVHFNHLKQYDHRASMAEGD